MSEFKTNKICPIKGTTQTIGDSGDTVSIPSGVTLSNAGTISGIQKIDWDTTKKTSAFTAVSQIGYFVDTTSAAITVTFPATPTAGNVIGLKDYANTFDTNNLTINPNGNNIQGLTTNFVVSDEGAALNFIYVDATRGWVLTDASKAADISQQALFTVATGGTITTCGDYKIHTFTGPGTFCVSQVGNCVGGPGNVDYLVVAGGGGGAGSGFGGGGGGGYRTTFPSPGCNAGSFPITATAFPITVGSGGTTGPIYFANPGSNSVFSTITSTGGGRGYEGNSADGGSGGGGGRDFPGVFGAGNTPPVSPPQGNDGGQGSGSPTYKGGGGGGAGGAGVLGSTNGNGGPGSANSITGSSVTRAGGGGGGTVNFAPNPAGLGGPGGGGNGSSSLANGSNGTVNTGGGGGGGFYNQPGSPQIHYSGGTGGSGIVVIRYKYQ